MGSLDADALVWISDQPAMIDQLRADVVRQQLTAAQEGREVWMTDPVLAGAASFSSVLSLPQVLDWIVPQLAAAVDGNTQTTAPAA
jgi:iron complex transport system substrate-binding protein